MYLVLVYDVGIGRVIKVCHFLRQYLNWVQNSVFEGELTEAELKKVEIGLRKRINPHEDSVTLYLIRTKKVLEKRQLGVEKANLDRII